MADARDQNMNRNLRNDGNPPQRPQPNPRALDAGFQAVVVHDPVLSWLSDLPEPKRSVAEAVLWSEVVCD